MNEVIFGNVFIKLPSVQKEIRNIRLPGYSVQKHQSEAMPKETKHQG